MEVLERYLQAVRYWLPVPQRDDIVAELSEDIRSEVEEQEAASGQALEAGALEALLRKRGHPMWVAERYLPAGHLIGPALLPIYGKVVKVSLGGLAALFAGLYASFGFVVAVPPKPELASLGFWLWSYVFYALAYVGGLTLLFAWIERAYVRARPSSAWDPRHPLAPPVPPGGAEAAEVLRLRAASLGHLVGHVIFTLWWVGVLPIGPVPGLDVRLAPVWNQLYWPVLLVAVSSGVLAAVLAVRPHRTRTLAALGLAGEAVGLVVIAVLLLSGSLVEVAVVGAPAAAAAKLARWANLTLDVTVLVVGVAFAAEVVRDVRALRGRPPIRHLAFRLLTGE
jgi:hypothetical protein